MAETTITADILDIKEINSANYTGTIIKFWELFDKNGQQGKRLWTAWFTADQKVNDLKPGDWVRITGDISAKVGKYMKDGQERQTVDFSLNNCKILKLEKTPLGTPTTPVIEEFPF